MYCMISASVSGSKVESVLVEQEIKKRNDANK